MSGPEIRFGREKEFLTLSINDYELFDFIDDYLTDLDLLCEFLGEEKEKNQLWFIMYFPPEIGDKKIKSAIASLDKNEIHRIWKLNN